MILTVSRLSYADRYKGVEDLIAAMPAIRAAVPAARLRVIGRGDDLPRLQGVARRLGLLDHGVEFLGPTDDKAVAAEMGACRLFALPSGREGFGLVFLEAMAQGRPCVGARAAAVPGDPDPGGGAAGRVRRRRRHRPGLRRRPGPRLGPGKDSRAGAAIFL